ncbi:MAG: Gfo/Idh/MocA family oxidoreductase, partial [Saprospiraceae bacterium]
MPKKQQQPTSASRRKFIVQGGTALAGFTIVPRYVLGGKGYTAPSDKLNIVGIGVGGKGTSNLEALASQNIVALCDVDYARAEESFKRFPKAKKYKDYRVMYDEMMKDIDAVVVSTPDHSHALPGLIALRNDKHVYIEKPL